jgi:hypothetical protein
VRWLDSLHRAVGSEAHPKAVRHPATMQDRASPAGVTPRQEQHIYPILRVRLNRLPGHVGSFSGGAGGNGIHTFGGYIDAQSLGVSITHPSRLWFIATAGPIIRLL